VCNDVHNANLMSPLIFKFTWATINVTREPDWWSWAVDTELGQAVSSSTGDVSICHLACGYVILDYWTWITESMVPSRYRYQSVHIDVRLFRFSSNLTRM
jgi:hypothetical protein